MKIALCLQRGSKMLFSLAQVQFCIDYQKLNQITKCKAFPLPSISDLFDSLKDAKLSVHWTHTMHIGKFPLLLPKMVFYKFLHMPFGLASAPSTFQCMMEIVLSGLSFKMCLCYLIMSSFSRTFDKHCEWVQTVLLCFMEHNLRVKLSKCTFIV